MLFSAIEMVAAPTKMPISNCKLHELVLIPMDEDLRYGMRPIMLVTGKSSIYKSFYITT